MNLEWIAEDYVNTLGHASKLEVDGRTALSPTHLFSTKDHGMAERHGAKDSLKGHEIVVAGKSLSYNEYLNVGKDADITNSIYLDLKGKTMKDKVNLVYQRIPAHHKVNDKIIPVARISDLQTSGIVGVQLELGAGMVIPPLYSGMASVKQFEDIYNRTKVEIQTWKKKEKPIMGYIPTTEDLVLVANMVKSYVKDGVKVFGVDFSSSPLNRWLLRTVVSAIRKNMKISGKAGERADKNYWLHVFNVPSNYKTIEEVAPITDILTHAYSVDSTSGVIWGGGKLVKDKLRYFDMSSYGACQIGALEKAGINCDKRLLTGSVIDVYEKLRVRKNIDYTSECETITSTLNADSSTYEPYLLGKRHAKERIKDALIDIREIKANS